MKVRGTLKNTKLSQPGALNFARLGVVEFWGLEAGGGQTVGGGGRAGPPPFGSSLGRGGPGRVEGGVPRRCGGRLPLPLRGPPPS